jgi:uncharacterized protein YndB with AHSA1/START domain
MEKHKFEITINAPREKVWKVLWDDTTYRQWASIFYEGSYVETDWQEGSKALFLSPEGEGMVSTIAANRPNEFMSIKHLGIVKNGKEDLESEEVKQWAGALENYTLTTVNGNTVLTVEMDITEEHKDYFRQTWPKALEKVKALAEKG